ncbi:MAG TPA: hypothetical protein VK119_13150 [Bacillota bacterium]|nr:hypothetical protein [Bacillota bacterium]
MKGTALLIKDDHTVTVLENVNRSVSKELAEQDDLTTCQCTINDKEVEFDSVSAVVWYEDSIDWNYGY